MYHNSSVLTVFFKKILLSYKFKVPHMWVNAFKNGTSIVCGRQPLKI